MNLSAKILKLTGWTLYITAPDFPKCIICVAPHTSNWDFILGKLAYSAVGRKSGFLMKSSWFFFPLGILFKSIGGIPVYRKNKKGSLVEQLIDKFNNCDRLTIAITPEGTRSRNPKWHTGFIAIAYKARIPIVFGALDYEKKLIDVSEVYYPSGNVEVDMQAVKDYFAPYKGKYPNKFTVDDQ